MAKVCTFLVGAPGVGKTTWRKKQEWIDDTFVASTDLIIEEIADQFGLTYDEAFKDVIGFAEKVMWRDLKAAAKDGDMIYIDRTNMSRKSRERFIKMLKPYGYTFNAVVFPNPDDKEWRRRLNNRPGKTISNDIIQDMMSRFQMPVVDEGFETVVVIEPEFKDL